MVFKSIIGAVCTCLAAITFTVNAMPMYTTGTGGDIIGISGLEVAGVTYDMTLHDGSLDDLWTTFGSTSVYTSLFASSASLALRDFAISSPVPAANDFLGCIGSLCYVTTVFNYVAEGGYGGYYTRYTDTGTPAYGSISAASSISYTFLSYATWTESTSVPEPSIATLLASGLIAFGVVRRKSRI